MTEHKKLLKTLSVFTIVLVILIIFSIKNSAETLKEELTAMELSNFDLTKRFRDTSKIISRDAGKVLGAQFIPAFTKDLKIGVKSGDVKNLQIFLNQEGFRLTQDSSKPGFLGKETEYFGNLTKEALSKYQTYFGISPSVGYFGPITRAHINNKILLKKLVQELFTLIEALHAQGVIPSTDLFAAIQILSQQFPELSLNLPSIFQNPPSTQLPTPSPGQSLPPSGSPPTPPPQPPTPPPQPPTPPPQPPTPTPPPPPAQFGSFSPGAPLSVNDSGFVGDTPTVSQCSNGIDDDGDGKTDWGYTNINDPFCSSPFDNLESNVLHEDISWMDFPNFTLNPSLTVVYGALPIGQCYQDNPSAECEADIPATPLQRGFSHIGADLLANQVKNDAVPPNKRAALWFPAGDWPPSSPINSQPWVTAGIPWGNLQSILTSSWSNDMAFTANYYSDTFGTGIPNVDLLVADVEKNLGNDFEILSIKNHPSVPVQYQNLSDQAFIDQYKHDLAVLYKQAIEYPAVTTGVPSKIGSYGDVPFGIRWWWLYDWPYGPPGPNGEPGVSWQQWTDTNNGTTLFGCQSSANPNNLPDGDNDPDNDGKDFVYCLNYLTFDTTQPPGPLFYENLGPLMTETSDVWTSSIYYAVKYPAINGPQQCSDQVCIDTWNHAARRFFFNLFVLDANQIWGNGKEQLTFQWMRVHDSDLQFGQQGLNPWMAHATAIFPFFTKDTGQWLWDWIGYDNSNPDYNGDQPGEILITDGMQSQVRIAYDNYIYGLCRLSNYNEFFEGNYQTYHKFDPRYLFLNSVQQFWRGVIKADQSKMLVAAYNPFSPLNGTTTFTITCPSGVSGCISGQTIGSVTTNGQGVWLGVCDINSAGGFSGCIGDTGGAGANDCSNSASSGNNNVE